MGLNYGNWIRAEPSSFGSLILMLEHCRQVCLYDLVLGCAVGVSSCNLAMGNSSKVGELTLVTMVNASSYEQWT